MPTGEELAARLESGPRLVVIVAGPGWGKDHLARHMVAAEFTHRPDPGDVNEVARCEAGRVVVTGRSRNLAAQALGLVLAGEAVLLEEPDLRVSEDDWRQALAGLGVRDDAAPAEALRLSGGWPAAIGLAALIARRHGPGSLPSRLTAREPIVRAYLEHAFAAAGDLLPALEELALAPEVTPAVAQAARPESGRIDLERAYAEGWLQAGEAPGSYCFHPLAREYLAERAATRLGAGTSTVQQRVAAALAAEGKEEEALELLAGAGAWEAYAARLESVGQGWTRSGEGERVRAALNRVPRAERDRPGLHYLEGQLALASGDLEGALASYARAEAHASSQEERARAQNSQGAALSQRGRYAEALARFRAALSTLAGGGESTLGGDIRNNSGVTWLRLGRYGDAQRAFREAARAYRAAGQRDREALTLHNLGVAHQERGEFLEAERAYEDALRLKRLTGARSRIPSTLVNLGELKRHLAQGVEARRLLEEARAICREDRDPVNEAYATVNLADLDLAEGEAERARRGYRAALALLEEGEDAHARAQALLGLARLEQLEGRAGEALTLLERVDEDERSSAWQLERGLALQALGERAAAEAALGTAVAAAREREASFDLARALLARAALTGSEADVREGSELRRRYGYETLPAEAGPSAQAPRELPGSRLYLLGRFGMVLTQRELTLSDLPTRKAAMVLASLALSATPLTKETLAERFWADSRNPTGSLDTALYHLRAALGKEAIHSARGQVSLALPISVDARDFLDAVAKARKANANLEALEAIRAAYGGPLLPEFPEEFELERRAVEEGIVWALEALAYRYQAAGRPEDAAGVWHDLLRVDPFHTGAHEWLIGHYEASGLPSRAQRQRELLETALAELS